LLVDSLQRTERVRDVNYNNQSKPVSPEDADIKKLVGGLKSEGIIKSENYSIIVQDNKLIVDSVALPEEMNNKYRKYFEGKGDFIITEHKLK